MTSKGAKTFWIIVLVVLAILVFAYITRFIGKRITEIAPQEGKVTIGAVVPRSGEGAVFGVPIERAARMALEEINQVGGVGGKTLEIIFEDGKCDSKEGSIAGNKLININKVKIILGGVCSEETLGFAANAETAKVIVISPSATSPAITPAGEFIFRTAPSDAQTGSIAASYAKEKIGAKKAAVISETTDYAQGLRSTFKDSFTSQEGEILLDETFTSSDTDFRNLILKVKNAKPDVIYLAVQTLTPGINIIQEIKKQGITTPILTTLMLIGRDVAKENAQTLQGVIGFEAYFDESQEMVKTFLEKYEKIYKEKAPFPFFMANMYSEVYLAKQLIEAHGEDTEGMRNALYAFAGPIAVLPFLQFDRNGDPIIKSYSVKKIENGEVVQVEVFTIE